MNSAKPASAACPSSGTRGAKLPPIFKVSLVDGTSFSVVRRDIMDSALGRGAKK